MVELGDDIVKVHQWGRTAVDFLAGSEIGAALLLGLSIFLLVIGVYRFVRERKDRRRKHKKSGKPPDASVTKNSLGATEWTLRVELRATRKVKPP